MKIRPEETELFHSDEQSDNDELIIAFHNFANAPKNPKYITNDFSFFFRHKFIFEITPNFESSCLYLGMKKRTDFLLFRCGFC
jgi:hypothetical protein